MTTEPKCYYCKNIIEKNYEIYMCVDKSFCSLYCRNKHFKYIMSIDPDLNNPYKWNKKNTYENNFPIALNYFINIKNEASETKSKKKLYKSKSLSNLLDNKENKTYIVFSNFNNYMIKITDKKLKYLIYICLTFIIFNIIIAYK